MASSISLHNIAIVTRSGPDLWSQKEEWQIEQKLDSDQEERLSRTSLGRNKPNEIPSTSLILFSLMLWRRFSGLAFIFKCHESLFDPDNRRKINDNLTTVHGNALKELMNLVQDHGITRRSVNFKWLLTFDLWAVRCEVYLVNDVKRPTPKRHICVKQFLLII